ncbi:MAG: glycosyltransferase family 2 protein [bacterium]|nr:glycosyltransferase family 2 protein [bacterium]MDZ4296311.1 glycosyltransferase family 2 protein [Patescibacteria group bacterium]
MTNQTLSVRIPSVSVGLPVRNGAERMAHAIDSLINQTHADFELIISDNCSTDSTWALLEEYARRDRRIRIFRQERDLGQRGNFEFVLAAARGMYFMWASDDDRWHPEFIATLKKGLDDHPEYPVAMCSYDRALEDGSVENTVHLTGALDLTRASYRTIAGQLFTSPADNAFIYGLFRKEFLFTLTGGRLPRSRFDRVLFCEATLAARPYCVPKVLFAKRVSRMAITARYRNDEVGQIILEPFSYLRFLFAMLLRVLTSPLVPFWRKPLVFAPWFRFIWLRKRKLVRDTARSFRFVLSAR